MAAREVILLRHGITDWNGAGRFQGHADVPLNADGRAQASRAAEAMASLGIGRIISSDLSRAAATSEIVADRLGLEVSFDAQLREINVGSWSGLTMDEVGKANPDFWPSIAQGRDFRRSPIGETGTEAGNRVAAAIIEQAAAAPDDEALLVVGHGMTTRVASMLLLGLTYAEFRLFAGLGNCQWVVLKPGAPHWRMIAYNRSS
jgi:glucosyl-3-phosphoglycerate phosphatase